MNLKNWKENWKELACNFIIIGCIQFFILTIIAMFFYAGGTYHDPSNPGYDFWNNFFSDLGITKTYNGRSNIVSHVLFTIALSVAGISIIPFLFVLTSFFKESKLSKWLSIIGLVIGIFTAICFIGIACTPANLYLYEHGNFVRLGFSSALFMVFFYVLAMLTDKKYPNRNALAFIGFCIVLGLYVIVLFAGPSYSTPEGWMFRVVSQKIVAYTMIASLLIQGYISRKMIKTH